MRTPLHHTRMSHNTHFAYEDFFFRFVLVRGAVFGFSAGARRWEQQVGTPVPERPARPKYAIYSSMCKLDKRSEAPLSSAWCFWGVTSTVNRLRYTTPPEPVFKARFLHRGTRNRPMPAEHGDLNDRLVLESTICLTHRRVSENEKGAFLVLVASSGV